MEAFNHRDFSTD